MIDAETNSSVFSDIPSDFNMSYSEIIRAKEEKSKKIKEMLLKKDALNENNILDIDDLFYNENKIKIENKDKEIKSENNNNDNYEDKSKNKDKENDDNEIESKINKKIVDDKNINIKIGRRKKSIKFNSSFEYWFKFFEQNFNK